MSDIKIGIYGGTFDPVHVGHIRSAYAFLDTCQLDKLYIIPTFIPPHKTICEGDDPKNRLQMLKIAFSQLPFYDDKIIISDYEILQQKTSYTYQTLEHFNKCISKDLTILCGTDNFLTLEKWKNFERVFELAKIAHIVRPNTHDESDEILAAKEKYTEKYDARIIDVPMDPIDISSTEVRQKIKDNQDTSDLITPEVRDYIDKYNIYGAQND